MGTTVVNFVFESGFSLTIFTLVYLLFLRRETFFVLNRIYLMAAVLFSILLPFIHFQVAGAMPSVMLGEVTVTATSYQNLLGTVTVYGTRLTGVIERTIQSIGLIRLIYLSGTAVFLILFLYRLFQVVTLILNNESEVKNGIRIVKIDRDTTPFSFFSFVFINRNNADSKGMKEMLAHEMEHVRQGHSFDVLILELLTIFQWFNPFVWLLKRSIRENHEFLADHGVLKPGVSSAAYRMLLLNSSFVQQPVIANNFNYSLVKIRIKMITKIKSPKTAAFKLSMGILVTAALLMIFAFDKDDYLLQDKKTPVKSVEAVVNSQEKADVKEPVEVNKVVEKIENIQQNIDVNETAEVNEPVVVSVDTRQNINVNVHPEVNVRVNANANAEINESVDVNEPVVAVNIQKKSKQKEEKVFEVVEEMPEFPGGEMALREFLTTNIKYPAEAQKDKKQGKVFVNFVVFKDGSVGKVKIVRGVSPSIDKEALRVVSTLPKWTPGKQKGEFVAVSYTVPIAFKLE